mgnify:CR=1 FL=1
MKNKFKIAIIGSGTMGNGIAHVSAQSGFHTTLVDIDKNQLNKALQNINFNLDRQINKKVISEIDKKNTLNKAQQDFKDNYVTTSVYNRSKAIYQAYPLLPSGVNANLAITNATNDEVRQVAQQTYRTQALQDNEYGRVPEGFFTKLKSLNYLKTTTIILK